MQEVLTIARALSDENRLRALVCLHGGEMAMTEVAEALRLAPSTVSRHLSILRRAGLIHARRVGRWHLFYLADGARSPFVATALEWVRDASEPAGQASAGNGGQVGG